MLRKVFRHKPSLIYTWLLENDLEIIPVLINDLPSANPEEVTDDIVDLLGCDPEEVIHASGKTGFGVDEHFKSYYRTNSCAKRRC